MLFLYSTYSNIHLDFKIIVTHTIEKSKNSAICGGDSVLLKNPLKSQITWEYGIVSFYLRVLIIAMKKIKRIFPRNVDLKLLFQPVLIMHKKHHCAFIIYKIKYQYNLRALPEEFFKTTFRVRHKHISLTDFSSVCIFVAIFTFTLQDPNVLLN